MMVVVMQLVVMKLVVKFFVIQVAFMAFVRVVRVMLCERMIVNVDRAVMDTVVVGFIHMTGEDGYNGGDRLGVFMLLFVRKQRIRRRFSMFRRLGVYGRFSMCRRFGDYRRRNSW